MGTMSDDEPDESRVVWSFTIDAAARLADVVWVRTEAAVPTEGDPFMMRHVSTEEKP